MFAEVNRKRVLMRNEKIKDPDVSGSFDVAESVGFEPTWDCSQTVFKTASL